MYMEHLSQRTPFHVTTTLAFVIPSEAEGLQFANPFSEMLFRPMRFPSCSFAQSPTRFAF